MRARYGRRRIASPRDRLPQLPAGQRLSVNERVALSEGRPLGANTPFTVSFTGLRFASRLRPLEVSLIVSRLAPLAFVARPPAATSTCLARATRAPRGTRYQEIDSRPRASDSNETV